MDKEYLKDYAEKEEEHRERFRKEFQEGRLGLRESYPPKSRFFNLNEPYAYKVPLEAPWVQIPLYGSTIIRLIPRRRKKDFEEAHGFSVEDIPRLVDFSKETGKVQFTLIKDPIQYQNMDFLDPIFIELRPPLQTYYPLSIIVDETEISNYFDEFYELSAKTDFLGFLVGIYSELGLNKEYIKTRWEEYAFDYAVLKALGYNSVVEELKKQLALNPLAVIGTLCIYSNVTVPYMDPLKAIYCYNRSRFSEISEELRRFKVQEKNRFELPLEAGKFLNDKLKLITPKNINGAIELNDEYHLYDLRKVMHALNESVRKEKPALVIQETKEISSILENIWSEADKFRRKVNIAKHGISLGIGVIGCIATLPLAGVGGLFSGLGFEVAEQIAEIKFSESISEKFVKMMSSSHMINVYDFRKKYKLL